MEKYLLGQINPLNRSQYLEGLAFGREISWFTSKLVCWFQKGVGCFATDIINNPLKLD